MLLCVCSSHSCAHSPGHLPSDARCCKGYVVDGFNECNMGILIQQCWYDPGKRIHHRIAANGISYPQLADFSGLTLEFGKRRLHGFDRLFRGETDICVAKY